MTVDPAEPETFRDRIEEDLDAEAPEADAVEQRTDLRPEEDGPAATLEPGEADDADAADQARVVPLDEEDYR
ncbi:hypothetical protein AB0P15_12315 [Streptomyces sp. NPDC087917]|uniref:hypothetical protein n=1 Tax=unclassified Streptomyces TaxID=2593676 RepID=UPI00341E8743